MVGSHAAIAEMILLVDLNLAVQNRSEITIHVHACIRTCAIMICW